MGYLVRTFEGIPCGVSRHHGIMAAAHAQRVIIKLVVPEQPGQNSSGIRHILSRVPGERRLTDDASEETWKSYALSSSVVVVVVAVVGSWQRCWA